MPTIKIECRINAPIEVCFNLSRSIDLQVISTKQTGEKAIAGVTNGLIDLNETVTWRARHFGIWQNMTSKITAIQFPNYFTDEMVQGIFKSFKHEHHFKVVENFTLMHDNLEYVSPLGILGKLADVLFLKVYLRKLLLHRNNTIKVYAESELWKQIL